MAIILDSTTKVIVQGITGKAGSYHALEMLCQGTNVVAGVSPGRGGERIDRIPIYDTVEEVVTAYQPDLSLILVPARFAKDAALEAMAAGIKTVVVVAEGVPIHDSLEMTARARQYGARLVGPNTPGIFSPGQAKAGIMPTNVFKPGHIGIVSRSGTLSYETASELSRAGLGQSTFVGLGGDMVRGTSFIDILSLFKDDPDTHGIVMIGEIGGYQEEMAAKYIQEKVTKPVIAFIAGRNAKPGRRMGHAGAIVMGKLGNYESKVQNLRGAGIHVADSPMEIARLMAKML